MSVVTGVTIISQDCADYDLIPLIDKLNNWIKDDVTCGGGELEQIDSFYGGRKHPENLVWGGGFNYLSWQEFIEYAKSLPWKASITLPERSSIVLIVSPDQRPMEVHYLHDANNF